ncbi:MAG TPA: LysR family transcriptional regulator [Burkholderiales bacterium]|jgi:DNA-binding transcriptional LysR family regulator
MVEKLNLNLLPIAYALYDKRSVSAAAKALGMSQPAVSMALRKLRTHFNDALFIRAPRGVEPTPRAHELVKASRPLVARLQEDLLSAHTFDAAHSARTFSFALFDIGEIVFLPRLIERLHAAAPHCPIRSLSMPPQQVARGLENGEVDLAIGYFPDLVQHNLFQQRLYTDNFACLMRVGHPLYAKRLSLKAFLEVEHAVVHAAGRSHEVVERLLERKRIRRKIALHTPHFLSTPFIVSRSDLVATVPYALALHFARLAPEQLAVAMPPFEAGRFDIKQYWHRKVHQDARNQWVRQQVAELFTDAAAPANPYSKIK